MRVPVSPIKRARPILEGCRIPVPTAALLLKLAAATRAGLTTSRVLKATEMLSAAPATRIVSARARENSTAPGNQRAGRRSQDRTPLHLADCHGPSGPARH